MPTGSSALPRCAETSEESICWTPIISDNHPVETEAGCHDQKRQNASEQNRFQSKIPVEHAGQIDRDGRETNQTAEYSHNAEPKWQPRSVIRRGPDCEVNDAGPESRQHEESHDRRYEYQPVQKEVAQIRCDHRPRIRRESAGLGRQKVGEYSKVVHGLWLWFEWRFRTPLKFVNDLVGALTMNPTRQPTGDIAAARDGGQVIELLEQSASGQALQDTQVEDGATDAAAG